MTENVKVDIYTDVKAALEGISTVKHVLHYNEQDLNEGEIISRNYPQCWIHFSDIVWLPNELKANNTNTTQAQKGDITLTVYISQFTLKEDNDSFLEHMSLINEVYRALILIDNENYTPLVRVSETDTAQDNVRIWQVTFTTQVIECGISDNKTDAAPVDLILNVGPF